MSNPPWREVPPSSPYGGEAGGGPPARDTRAGGDPRAPRQDPRVGGEAGEGRPDPGGPAARRPAGPGDDTTRRTPAQGGRTQPIAPQSRGPQPGPGPAGYAGPGGYVVPPDQLRASRRPDGPDDSRRGGAGTPGGSPGRLSRIWHGSLRGWIGVCVIIGSAALGAIATIMTRAQPGMALGLFVLAGTVVAALTVEPRAGRAIFPVPALSYLVAALAAGVAYNRSADQTQLAIGAAQWIANGFFVMALATLLAVALTTVRWVLRRRGRGARVAADVSAPAGPSSRPQAAPPQSGRWGDPGSQGAPPGMPPGTRPVQWPGGAQGTRGWDQRPGQGTGPGPDRRPGPGPYNFSSGA